MFHENLAKDLLNERDLSSSEDEEEGEDDEFEMDDSLTRPRVDKNVMKEYPFSPPEHDSFMDKFVGKDDEKELEISQLLSSIYKFYKKNNNFDSMPPSSKVIVFDMDIGINDALKIACENDISYATLWDKKVQSLTGMLTVSDLIDILLYCENKKDVLSDLLLNKTIRNWRELISDSKKLEKKRKQPDKLIYINPDDRIWSSICLFLKHQVHRLPVLSKDGSLLHVLTDVSVLTHLVRFADFNEKIFTKSLKELSIGVFEGVYTCQPNQKLFDILEKFNKLGVSSVPIIDAKGAVIDIYTKSDVVFLLREDNSDYYLDCTIQEALKTRPKTPLFTCRRTEPFGKVIRHLTGTRIHKLVCVDENFQVEGIISITDIFEFFIKHYQEYSLKEQNQ